MQDLERGTKSRIIRGFVATLFGSGFAKFVLAAATFLFTHIMTKNEFGEFSFVRNTLNTILCMSALNFTSLCTKFTVEAANGDVHGFGRLRQVFVFSLAVCLSVGIALIVLPFSTLDQLFESHRVSFSFKIIGVLLPLFMLQPLIEGMMRGMEDFKLIGILQSITASLFVALVFVGYLLGGVNGAISGIALYYLAYSFVCIVFFYKRYPKLWAQLIQSNRFHERSVVSSMILPIFFMSFFEAPVLWIAQLFLSRFGSMEAVGSMAAILQLRNLAILIPSYFANTFLTFATEANAQKDYCGYFKRFDKIAILFLVVGLLVFSLFSLGGKQLLFLYGKDYVTDWACLIIASIGIPIMLLITLFRVDLVIQEHQRKLMYISIAWNIIWLVSLYILLKSNVQALPAFFISQLIGWLFNLICYLWVYLQDKKRLL